MGKIATLELEILENSLEVSDPEVSVDLDYDFSASEYNFASGKANFPTEQDCESATIEVWVADTIQLMEEDCFAVVVPFPVGNSGVHVMNIHQSEEIPVEIPPGHYALVYELKSRNSSATIEQDEYRDECRLTFVRQDVVKPIVLVNQWLSHSLVDDGEAKTEAEVDIVAPNVLDKTAWPMRVFGPHEMRIHFERIEIIDERLHESLFDPESIPYDWENQQHENYEFTEGRAGFCACPSSCHAVAEVWLANEIELQPATQYAAVVPFSVGKSGVFLSEVTHCSTIYAKDVPAGRYALLYELKPREVDENYRQSEWYEDYVDDQRGGSCCRFTFVPQEFVEARELIPKAQA